MRNVYSGQNHVLNESNNSAERRLVRIRKLEGRGKWGVGWKCGTELAAGLVEEGKAEVGWI